MQNQLTQQQIEWAKRHDWFSRVHSNGCIVVCDHYTKDGKSFQDHIIWTKSFKELCEWAGY